MHFAIVFSLLVIAAGIAFVVVSRKSAASTSAQIRPSGIPSNISTQLANLMELSPTQNVAAPGFTLTDQNGKTLSLSSFSGHAVVLEFMDPNCTDICPLIAQEFVDAYHDLGPAASKVDFLAINVNQYHLSQAAVARFTNEHGLKNLPNWHFLTGPLPQLQKLWKDYGITVDAPSPTADVIHTSVVYFIGSNGHEKYLASPIDYHTPQGAAYLPANQLTAWGHGIAVTSKDII